MTAVIEDAQDITVSKWDTLNTAASPNKLPEGHSPRNQNVWMDEKPGSVVTANGYLKLGQLPSGLPPTLLIEFFKASDGTSQLIASDGQNVYKTTDYVTFTTIKTGLSEFFQLRGKVIRDKLWLTNGLDPVMTWDGTTLTILDGSGSTPNVPKGKFIDYHDERVFMYGIDGDLSSLRFTALANSGGTEIAPDNSAAWPVSNEIQISEGDADIGTGLFLYRAYLYCSKQFSIWRIVGDDEYNYTRVKTRASTGTRFQESIQIKDNLVHFIGVDGLYVFDGEEAKRISDIVDPASADTGVFAFRNLQQPLLNNKFWNVSDTSDFDNGTYPHNIVVSSDQIQLVPADDTQADFTAGTRTNTAADHNPGFLQLDLVASGGSSENVLLGGTPFMVISDNGTVIGSIASINDNNLGIPCGFNPKASPNQITTYWQVLFGSTKPVGSVSLRGFYAESRGNDPSVTVSRIEYFDGANWNAVPGGSVSLPALEVFVGSFTYLSSENNFNPKYRIVETDLHVSFNRVNCTGIRYVLTARPPSTGVNGWAVVLKEMQAYRTPFFSTGKFVSKAIDYGFGVTPGSYGVLAASIVSNGEAYQFFTQSSNDGSTWDAEVNVANGAAIGSALKRYLRWGVYLNSSSGLNTPVIDKVFVGGSYISEVHDTGGNIFQWSPFQMVQDKAGQTISAYIRAAATSLAVASEPWTAIVPGAIPSLSASAQFVQVKFDFSTINTASQPLVDSFTVNWILNSGAGANTLQNVASIVILNRYWLSAATLGANANDIIIVLGKSTFGSPYHTKDFQILSFCRFQDYYIAGSSIDGSIYRLEYGFSKNGSAMDSFYETADFSKSDFFLKGRELLVTADRSGPYNLDVGFSIDGGLTWTERQMDLTRESGTALSYTKKFNINFMSDSVRFRVRTNAADQPFSVDEMKCYYRLSPQRGTLI